ncbi:FAD-binding protein [Kribbella sp. NPDC050281]|uniref:FAD-binding protein n=1 Tax=Kribbella sp. NPDC050281 TaxID=3155515 RepID=UPI0033C2110F
MEPQIPPLDGELRFDEVTRQERTHDFGHIVHQLPDGVRLPGSADDVAKTIQWTAQRGSTFAPQGQRHSTFGRSQTRGGIVADLSMLNFVRMPTTGDTDDANRLVETNEAVYRRVKAAGGTLYPVSALPLSKDEWRDHFGSAYGQLDAAKRQYDPNKILTPGYPIF